MKRFLTVIPFSLLFLFSGCNKNQEVRPVIKNYADIVLANYEDALSDAKKLDATINEFVQSPSDSTLNKAKEAWLNARESYGQSEAFRFYGGPIDDENGPEGQLNAWPLDESYIDYVNISSNGSSEAVGVNIINSPDAFPDITKEMIASLNEQGSETNVSSGYHAVEFLLWGQDVSDGPGGGERPYTDYKSGAGGTHNHQQRRAAYLTEASALIVDDLQSLVDAWANGANNYRATFTSEEQVERSLGKILNGIGKLSKGELAGERMFVAWDLRSKEDEHSCFSDNTHRDIVANAIGIRNVLTGEYARTDGSIESGPAILDLISDKDAELAEELLTTVNNSIALAKRIEAPFDQEILDKDGRQRILETINSLRKQGDLIAEAAALLGYTVNPDAI